jgi:hypothetical protein
MVPPNTIIRPGILRKLVRSPLRNIAATIKQIPDKIPAIEAKSIVLD